MITVCPEHFLEPISESGELFWTSLRGVIGRGRQKERFSGREEGALWAMTPCKKMTKIINFASSGSIGVQLVNFYCFTTSRNVDLPG